MTLFGYLRDLLGFGRETDVFWPAEDQSEGRAHGVESKVLPAIADVTEKKDVDKLEAVGTSTAQLCLPYKTSSSKRKVSLRKTKIKQKRGLLQRYQQRKMLASLVSRASGGRRGASHRAAVDRMTRRKALETSMAELNVSGDVSMDDSTMQPIFYECGACLESFALYDHLRASKHTEGDTPQSSSSASQSESERVLPLAPNGTCFKFRCHKQFCFSCLRAYLDLRLKDAGNGEQLLPISCPECKGGRTRPQCITTEHLKLLLSKIDYERYEQLVVVENMSSKIYCPNPSCAIIYDTKDIVRDGRTTREPAQKVKCPMCSVVACINCKSIWHDGFTCESFKSRPLFLRDANDEEASTLELVRQQGWARCPKCGEGIELKDGCNHMRCKCGYNFCYLCLSIWSTTIRNGITVEKCARGDQGGSPCPLYTENSLRGIIQRQGPQMRRHDMKWISEDRTGVPYQKSNTFTRHMLASRKCGYCDFKSKKWNGLINHLETADHDVYDCCAKFYKTRADFDSHVRNTHPRRQWVPAAQVLHRQAK